METMDQSPSPVFDPAAFSPTEQRPNPKLLGYYVLSSLLLGPFFLFLLVPRFFRYQTLHYRFGEEGISMRWGIFFRREISLTYSRIQDIHLASNIVERWLGLARVQVQTASGAAEAEMTIEGLEEYALIRDFLYSRMRGVKAKNALAPASEPGTELGEAVTWEGGSPQELVDVLRQVAVELRGVRRQLEGSSARQDE